MTDVLDLTTFKAWARTELGGDDSLNESAIDAGASQFFARAGRIPTLVTGATVATVRTFRPEHCTDVLWLQDAAEITSVVEDGTTLTVDVDYIAEPYGNRNDAGFWRPYDRLYRLDSWWFTDGRRRTVEVTAKWGWTAFDPLVAEAVKVLAADWLNNRNNRSGIISATADGFSVGMRTNPLVEAAIQTLRGPLGIGMA